MNTMITEEQKSCIQATPFAWMLSLGKTLKMSKTLLRELCFRWVERRGGFWLRSVFVPFTQLDVCVSLGLRVAGENIDLGNNNIDCQTRTIFHSTNVSVDMIYDELIKRANGSKQCSVDEFCRLYILLGLSEFLLPNRSGRVFSGLFKIVDNI